MPSFQLSWLYSVFPQSYPSLNSMVHSYTLNDLIFLLLSCAPVGKTLIFWLLHLYSQTDAFVWRKTEHYVVHFLYQFMVINPKSVISVQQSNESSFFSTKWLFYSFLSLLIYLVPVLIFTHSRCPFLFYWKKTNSVI